MQRLLPISLILLAALALGGCGGTHSVMGHDEGDGATAMDHAAMDHGSMDHSPEAMGTGRDADVRFTQEMIPHHQQAVELADLALDPARQASPQVQDLARRIRAAQAAEIEDMNRWLAGWGADRAAADGHADGDHMDEMGMLGDDQMRVVRTATGPAFDRLWLEGMIAHHEGAIVMASHIREAGDDRDVQALADAITESQRREIDEMRGLLGS
jgi:uncharacterized protein (DUF305 family)